MAKKNVTEPEINVNEKELDNVAEVELKADSDVDSVVEEAVEDDNKIDADLERELTEVVESTEQFKEEMETMESMVGSDDILSAVHSDIQEVLDEKALEEKEKEDFKDELDELEDESDLPVWDDTWEDDEDFWDDDEDEDDSEEDSDFPLKGKFLDGLGRYGRLRKSVFESCHGDDEDDIDEDIDSLLGYKNPVDNIKNPFERDVENPFGYDSKYNFKDRNPFGCGFGCDCGSSYDSEKELDTQKSGLDNMKSHLEDRVESVGKKIIDNKGVIAAGILGTATLIGGIVAYKFFKYKK